MYPEGFSTTITVTEVSEGLCGSTRPGHFDGVATVVAKLFLQTDADKAFFGEKDYQQLQVVHRLAKDLDLKTQIIGCPTVRENVGLAMSSRNLRLGKSARLTAPIIRQVLEQCAKAIRAGLSVNEALKDARAQLLNAGLQEIDYLELRSDPNLELLTTNKTPSRLFVAAWLDGVRLIDNQPVDAA